MQPPLRARNLGPVLVAVALLAACESPTATSSEPIPETAPPPVANVAVTDEDGFTRVDGEKAGALFRAIRPDDWNGDLVLAMHGTVPPEAPIALFDPIQWWTEPAVDALVDRGYGVALSSYRVNGYAVKEGALDTRIARAMFVDQFGEPSDTYLYGWSMGGSIGQMLLETSSARYDGLFSVCGGLGPSVANAKYGLDARVLFDHHFPGVLPWSVWEDRKSLFADVLPALQGAFEADPAAFVEKGRKMASIDQLDLPLGSGSPPELLLSILGSLLRFGGGAADLVDKAHGRPVGNAGTVYTSDLLGEEELVELNENVARFEPDPEAARYLERYYTPDGRTGGTPVLALHTDGDAVVRPALNLTAYEQILEEAGNGDSFVARVVPGFGHCEFGGDLQPDGFLDVQLDAFEDLVAWAEGGPKPSP